MIINIKFKMRNLSKFIIHSRAKIMRIQVKKPYPRQMEDGWKSGLSNLFSINYGIWGIFSKFASRFKLI